MRTIRVFVYRVTSNNTILYSLVSLTNEVDLTGKEYLGHYELKLDTSPVIITEPLAIRP